MPRSKEAAKDAQSASSHRASVSFPPEIYRTVALIAEQKKVSIAWVVRDAVEKYVADQWPLLKERTS